MPVHTRISGSFQELTQPHVRIGGVWEAPKMHVKIGGVWEVVHSGGPTVSIAADGRYNTVLGATCYAGMRYYSTGVEYEITATNGSFSKGNWLDSGAASECYVQANLSSGTWSSAPAGRVVLSSNRSYIIWKTSAGTKTVTAQFAIYDAASGGNLLDSSGYSIYSAEYDFEVCPLCCFTPDTPVRMASGIDMPIGKIKEGDMIVVADPETGERFPTPVEEVIVRTDRPMFRLHFEDGRTLDVSEDHPFSVEGKKIKSINPTIEYKDLGIPDTLQVGDRVTDYGGKYCAIVRIDQLDFEGAVFTFSNSLFFANGLLVY